MSDTFKTEIADAEVELVDITWDQHGEILTRFDEIREDENGTVRQMLECIREHVVSIDGDPDYTSNIPLRRLSTILWGVQDFFGQVMIPPKSGDS